VGSGGGSILLAESVMVFHEEWALIGRWPTRGLLGAPRIRSTNTDDLLANHTNFLRCGCSPDRVTTGTSGSVVDTVDDEAE
jgi:hypothetical protein